VYGLAGVCAGPLLGAVLTLAGLGGSALYGGLVLVCFAAGMALPLFVLALLWGRMPFVARLVRPRELRIGPLRTTWTDLVSGVVTIAIGVLLLATNGTADLGGILGATEQAALEQAAAGASRRIPDVAVLAGVAAIAVAGWAIGRRAARKPEEAGRCRPRNRSRAPASRACSGARWSCSRQRRSSAQSASASRRRSACCSRAP